jgi:hypothetical protein
LIAPSSKNAKPIFVAVANHAPREVVEDLSEKKSRFPFGERLSYVMNPVRWRNDVAG